MDALILSCGTGGGHNSAAAAIAEELTRRGHQVTMFNPYDLKSRRISHTIDYAYIRLVQFSPRLFGALYWLGDLYRCLPWRSPIYFVQKKMGPVLAEYLQNHHFDVIVMSHLFPAEIISQLKNRGIRLPETFFVATDYTCSPFVEETLCDHYIIPCEELQPEFVRRGIAPDKLVPLGIPVRRAFAEPAERREARRRLGLEPDSRYCLIFGGSVGVGSIPRITRMLLNRYGDSLRLIVVCGNNDRLFHRLTKRCGDRITLLHFTDRIADYLSACDLILSKPGGLSSTEAAAVGTALIHLAPIPGCESRNQHFFASRGMSLPVNSLKKELIAACDQLLQDEQRAEMVNNQHRHIRAHSAAAICDRLEQAVLSARTPAADAVAAGASSSLS